MKARIQHPCMTEAQALEWETWRAMAQLITESGIDFDENKDISKAIAAWGYRFLLLMTERNSIDPPLFYNERAEERIRDAYLKD